MTRRTPRAALSALTSAVAIAGTVNVVSLSYGLDEDIRRDIGRFGRLTVDVGRAPVVRPGGQLPLLCGREPLAAVRTHEQIGAPGRVWGALRRSVVHPFDVAPGVDGDDREIGKHGENQEQEHGDRAPQADPRPAGT
jgi:hypothetical protein